MQESDWKSRESSLHLFGCILPGLSSDTSVRLGEQIKNVIYGSMTDNHKNVKRTASYVFMRMCDCCPTIIDLTDSEVFNLIKAIIEKETAKVTEYTLCGIEKLALFHKNEAIAAKDRNETYNNPFSQIKGDLIEIIINRAQNSENYPTLMIAGMETVCTLVRGLEPSEKDVAKNLLTVVVYLLCKEFSQNLKNSNKDSAG